MDVPEVVPLLPEVVPTYRASYCTTRLVRFLYRMRYPHSLQRMTSPGLIAFSEPHSPHRYATPSVCGCGTASI